MRNSLRLTPATGVALIALFFALGGSAFAIGTRTAVAQTRCAQGAVRGIAIVQGEPLKGIANMTDQFSASPALFARKFNCTVCTREFQSSDRYVRTSKGRCPTCVKTEGLPRKCLSCGNSFVWYEQFAQIVGHPAGGA